MRYSRCFLISWCVGSAAGACAVIAPLEDLESGKAAGGLGGTQGVTAPGLEGGAAGDNGSDGGSGHAGADAGDGGSATNNASGGSSSSGGSGSTASGGSGSGGGGTGGTGGTGNDPDPDCPAGTYRKDPDSQTCRSCSPGTFSGPGATDCEPWTICEPGTYVSQAGSSVTDQACQLCAEGTQSIQENQSQCLPPGACQAGQVQTKAATESSPAECADCSAGSFCAGGTAPEVSCGSGVWDHDTNPGTACIAWTSCTAGSFLSSPGDAITDQSCEPCASGSFSSDDDVLSCSSWTTCAAGTWVSQAGGPTRDRECTACGAGTFSSSSNAANCSNCQAGSYSQSGAASCTACAAGTYSDAQKASSCTSCPYGVVSQAGATSCYELQVTGGVNHTCVLLEGNVHCWGRSNFGQLGYANETTIGDDETAAAVGNVNIGSPVRQIGAGEEHTCAVLTNGNVRCWGAGLYGRLGYGNSNDIGDTESPAFAGNVNIGGTVASLAVGGYHNCALLTNGNVRCWGYGRDGSLGYGNTNDIGDTETPASAGNVNIGGTVQQLVAGTSHTCALLTTGKVRCWGDWTYGRLGYGKKEYVGDNETPASAGDVNVPGTAIELAAGYAHTCALLSDGDVRCWGNSYDGQTGYGNTNDLGDDEVPADYGTVNVGGKVAHIFAKGFHTCALLTTGKLRCWGMGDSGQLGYANMEKIGDDETPASAGDVNVGGNIGLLSLGNYHTCAVLTTGKLRCWGFNKYGQLGYGHTNNLGDDETPASIGDVPW